MMYVVPISSHTCKEGFVVGTLWPCGCRRQTRLVFSLLCLLRVVVFRGMEGLTLNRWACEHQQEAHQ